MKICNHCNIKKSIIKFSKNRSSAGGRLPICAECHYLKYKHLQRFVRLTKEQILKKHDTHRFGGNQIKCLIRDDYKCVICGMTNEDHLLKFNRRITVDHKDNQGRNVIKNKQNNDLENLQTLCLHCHGRKDGKMGRGVKHGNK